MGRIADWWEGGAAVMIAILFWIIVGILVIAASAHESLDLFIKALTAAATAGLGIAVWQTTRSFQVATILNAQKKHRLDLFEKRLPVWTSFKELRRNIRHNGEVYPGDLATISDLRNEAEMLFGNDELNQAFSGYANDAFIASGSPVRIGIGEGFNMLPTPQIQRDAAHQRMAKKGDAIASLLKSAIQIADL